VARSAGTPPSAEGSGERGGLTLPPNEWLNRKGPDNQPVVDLLQMVMGGLMLLAVALVELVIVLAAINSRRYDQEDSPPVSPKG
jgi:hypothetical protein